MRILLVWDSEYPWDIRIEKMAKALAEGGHSVHLLARNKEGRPRHESGGPFEIHRIAALPAPAAVLNTPFTFPAFFNPVWLAGISRESRGADLIIVRDLPLAPAAMAIAAQRRIPVILDMAECYPEMLRAIWQFSGARPLDYLVRNPYLADRVERWVLPKMDQVLVMVPESRDRLIRLGVSPERISIVSNTPIASRFMNRPVEPAQQPRERLELLYVGVLGYSRGLADFIRHLAAHAKGRPPVHLTIYGTGRAERDLKRLVGDLAADLLVSLEGYLPNHHLPDVLQRTDVGVIPHKRCSHWDHTIPNKLFDYMAAARPVLATDAIPMARILSETNAGVTYRESGEDLARALDILQDPEVRHRLGANGRRAVETKYNWEQDKAVLLEAVERVAYDRGR